MLSYQHDESGDWLAATQAGRLVVVRTEDSERTVDRLWSGLDGGVQGVLDALTSEGVFTAPPFVLLTWEGDLGDGATVHAIVRGDVALRLSTGAGEVLLSGAGVATWREQSVASVTAFLLECGPATDEFNGRLERAALPLSCGMVRSRWIVLNPRGAASRPGAPVVAVVPVAPVAPIAPTAPVVPVAPVAPVVPVVPVAATVAAPPVSVPQISDPQIIVPPVSAPVIPVPDEAISDETVVNLRRSVGRPPGGAPESSVDTDHHDGLTVMSGDLHKLRSASGVARPEPGPPAPVLSAPVVPAPALPALFLLLPGGGREPLGPQPVLIGRAPSVSQVPGGRLPRLVSLGGRDQDISRNHVRVTVEGDTVVVTDLQSRNGTVIVLPGRPPQKLRRGESASVLVGTVIDLGSGLTLTVSEE
ncbi:FHA domain-containing protein [Cryobacterium sp. TmT2-59]|uniref:FHA domain-containing protein n=1 Tax=Cryobacterium sp. TmT2-59 TaxID=1259264 RepID=UPI00106A58F6|nr:FHA domain-containing protein [Cryobacterium sp. TmT2-59]TFC87798.1 FHA domain-containing protein [Cryobacterium sp. TmT2-59]